ncbi:MotA/TolQ/ExbB proton channel family protein [Muricoccus radiodurans]|uniref:MotA/TolQ/ExbB proton channel family protein n=1 Tax=Muricoccus radiodurans TaxID=2231721 RepID=UPI003CEB5067
MDPTAAPHHDLSALGLFLQADPIVKGVMLSLVLASLASWTIIIEKFFTLRRLRREVSALAAAGEGNGAPTEDGLAAAALRAGMAEWRDGRDPAETVGEHRHRIEGAIRDAAGGALHRASAGLQILSTTGSVAPFVGLFGTVWGIMNSFSGIARSNDTSLAVVAPGIAEALFATAIGLVAAIPAVMAYNRLSSSFAARRRAANEAASRLARRLARRRPEIASGLRAAAE